ncbi:MAG: DMT family transporter [Betaproteobacteria bacterium]|nr:MAG: DMT family transporter [Betaproteobacteria bacterium]
MTPRGYAIACALASAALFGASTPFAKLLLGDVSPWLLAAILYLGSGLGLAVWLALRPRAQRPAPIASHDWPWLAAAIACGGVIGPVLLMYGLAQTDAGSAALLLNLEAVLTAVIAWTAFRENVERRVFAGLLAIVAGGMLLAWEQAPRAGSLAGPLLVAAACLAWAIDNNLTRRVSGGDAVFIACLKGLVAGGINLALALAAGAALPPAGAVAAAALLGLLGYGVSLVLFILALRALGTARTGAYFSVAPFFGAALALALLAERPDALFWIAAALMALGVWLHVTERHEHRHAHQALEHSHAHVHDAHHRHAHDFPWDGGEPHAHRHRHEPLVHTHPHDPDLHHRHRH